MAELNEMPNVQEYGDEMMTERDGITRRRDGDTDDNLLALSDGLRNIASAVVQAMNAPKQFERGPNGKIAVVHTLIDNPDNDPLLAVLSAPKHVRRDATDTVTSLETVMN